MKKTLSLILAALMLAAVFCASSCAGESGTEGPGSSAAADSWTVAETAAETALKPDLPDVKFGGSFVIASGYVTDSKYTSTAITADTVNGDVINDAIYERTVTVESLFDIKIEVLDVNNTKINNSVKTGTREYDIGTATTSEIMSILTAGSAINLNEVESIDLDKPWWDQNAKSKFAVADKLYYTLSDFFITGIDNSRCTYFNKDLASSLNLGSLYELVDKNEWTIDKMKEMSVIAVDDRNGDQKIDTNDQLGIVNNATTFYEVMLTGCNAEVMKQGEGNIPYWTGAEEQEFFVGIYTKLLDLFSKDGGYLITSTDDGRRMFKNGNSLFTCDTMFLCSDMRQNSDINFGIMPVPKYSADQEKYYHVSPNPDVFFIIPGTSDETERCGVMLEALSYYSSAYYSDSALMPSYFDLALTTKSAPDVDSSNNLQIVHDNISYIIKLAGTVYSGAVFSQFENGNYNIISTLNTMNKSNAKTLRDVLTSLGVEAD